VRIIATITVNYATKDTIGIREDLEDIIYRIDPTETPFTSGGGRSTATQRYHEWQIQKLATAAPTGTNAAVEGADAKAATAVQTSRVGNRTQIMTEVVNVSGTNRVVDAAGRADELEYQILLKGLELKRAIEVQMIQNSPSRIDNGTLAGLSAGFESWLTTNVDRGPGNGTAGASGGFSAGIVNAPTDANATRAFQEAMLKSAMASCYNNGGKPTILSLGVLQKQVFSTFQGIAVNRFQLTKPEMGTIIGAADIYVSDFGQLAVVPNIFQRNRSALLISPKYYKICTLRGMRNFPLAKTGDADKREILTELTLEVCNEAAHAVIADLS